MANSENLIPLSKRTPSELREMRKKGGIKSGQVRREKADFKKAAQRAIDASYTTESGQAISGDDVFVNKIMKVALDIDHRNWATAMNMLISLTTKETKTSKDRLVDMQIKLLQAKIDALTNIKNADRHDGKLADLIEGLMVTDDIHEETAAVNGTVAEQETEKNKHS